MNYQGMADRPGVNTPKTTKLATILGLFLNGYSLNRFEAERHHDHCLNTTVSTLQNEYGIQIDRARESVPCKHGTAWVSVNRYKLNTKPENMKWAQNVLARWEGRT